MGKEWYSKTAQAFRVNKGFTLIELIVVIVVIAILIAAFLFYSRGLGQDAKASKLKEAVHGFLQAYQSCKLKNGSLTANSWTDFENALKDSLCRTSGAGVPDGKGIATSVQRTVAGVTFNINPGTPPTLVGDVGDIAIATSMVRELHGLGCTCPGVSLPVTDPNTINCTGTTVTCPLN